MIKKTLYCLSLALLATSCNEDFDDWTLPQGYDQEETADINFAITAGDPVDVATAEDVLTLYTFSSSMPEGFIFDHVTSVIEGEDKTYDVPVTIDGTTVSISKADITSVVEDMYGKRPVARKLPIKSAIYAYTSATKTKIVRSAFRTDTIYVTPEAPVIEQQYYYIGAANSWNTTDQTYIMSNGGGDVYDNPVFTVTVPAAGGDHWFKIAPQSAYDRGDKFWEGDIVGVAENGYGELSGKITVGPNDEVAKAWCLKEDANPGIYYTISVNMLDQTYTITPILFNDYIFYASDANGWSPDQDKLMSYGTGLYRGYYYAPATDNTTTWGIKFVDAGKWMGVTDEGLLGEGGNILIDKSAVYQMNVDLNTNTYSLTEVTSITVVGNFNSWNEADAATHMSYNATDKCWEATLNLTADGFKFAMNDSWTFSWGGANGDPAAYDNLTEFGGKDLNLPDGPGTYHIQLYISCEGQNKVVLTKK